MSGLCRIVTNMSGVRPVFTVRYRRYRERVAIMTPGEILAYPPCVLTQEQRELFYHQGYLALSGLVPEAALHPLRVALDRIVESVRDLSCSSNGFDLERDHSAARPRLRRAAYLDDQDPLFWELCSDSVISDIAADLLGPDIRFRDVFANFKLAHGGAQVDWHQDIAFYPHTNSATCQFLLALEAVGPEQGPLEVVPGSHNGAIYEHYGSDGRWTGAISNDRFAEAGIEQAVALTGPAGLLTVHHSRTIHGSDRNLSDLDRPVLVITYSAADAIPYTAPPYPSSHYGELIRGTQPRYAHHEELRMPLPPDWSGGYTSIFEHQEDN